ncbi:hypothetical protein Tco_0591886 [Tanacetum coccineum]
MDLKNESNVIDVELYAPAIPVIPAPYWDDVIVISSDDKDKEILGIISIRFMGVGLMIVVRQASRKNHRSVVRVLVCSAMGVENFN